MKAFTLKHKGFGLMEAVVVTGIFAVSMTVVTTILINSLKFQRSVKAEQIVVGAARDAIETLAREIRLGYIDYDSHLNVSGSELLEKVDHLYLRASTEEIFNFQLISGQLVATSGGVNYPLSSTDINITNLAFYVKPSSDPYWIEECTSDLDCDPTSIPVKITDLGPPPTGTCTAAGICEIEDIQPEITIILRAEIADSAPGRFATVDLQTTVSARVYKR